MITKEEEVIHCCGKEVLREEEHPRLEEWHTVLAFSNSEDVAWNLQEPQAWVENTLIDKSKT